MGTLEGLFIGAAMLIPCVVLLCAAIWSAEDLDDNSDNDLDDDRGTDLYK